MVVLIQDNVWIANQVIQKLSTGSKHINYRDSKLTRILQNSIGRGTLDLL